MQYSNKKSFDSNEISISQYDDEIKNDQKNKLNFTQIIKTLEEQIQQKNEALEIYKENINNREKKRLILKSKIIRLIKNFEMIMLQRFTTLGDFVDKKFQLVELVNEKVRKNLFFVRSEPVEESQILEYRKRDCTKQEVRIAELSGTIQKLKMKLKEQCSKYIENQKNLTEIITDTQREARELRRALQAAQEELTQKQGMMPEHDKAILKAPTTDSKKSLQNVSSKQLSIQSKLNISTKHTHKFNNKLSIGKSQKIFVELIPKIQEKLENFITLTLTKICEAIRRMKNKIQKISYTQSAFIVHKENKIKELRNLLKNQEAKFVVLQHKNIIKIDNLPVTTIPLVVTKGISTHYTKTDSGFDNLSNLKLEATKKNDSISIPQREQEDVLEFLSRRTHKKHLYQSPIFIEVDDKIHELKKSIMKGLIVES